MSSDDDNEEEEEELSETSDSLHFHTSGFLDDEAEEGEEEEEEEEEEEVSGASESGDVGTSGFLDDEAMEVELSSEEWVEGSGESDGSNGVEGGFIVDEAVEEEVYQARKRSRRRARILSDSDCNTVSETEVSVSKKSRLDREGLHSFVEDSNSSDDGSSRMGGEEGDSVVNDTGEELKGEGASGFGADSKLRWKEGLAVKATKSFNSRSTSAANLQRLIYSASAPLPRDAAESSDDERQIGGLFQLAKKKAVTIFHSDDTSLVKQRANPSSHDATAPGFVSAAKALFVTGDWGAEGAQALLDEDDALYGDFEDIENGGEESEKAEGGPGEEEEVKEKKRLEKKKKLKAAFDVGYDEDEGGGGASYLDDLKREVSEQEQRNRAEFEGMDERTRLQYEGVRPGYYVRVELKGKLRIV